MCEPKNDNDIVDNVALVTASSVFYDIFLNTPLHYAAVRNQKDVVLTEINKGYDIDFPNDFGWTPLMMATRYGYLDIVKILIDNKANATKCNRYGISVFQIATSSGNLDVIQLILQHLLNGGVSIQSMELTFSPISIAVIYNYKHVIKYLVEKSFDVNCAFFHTGIPPIMFAVVLGNSEITQYLLAVGADIYIKNLNDESTADIMNQYQNDVLSYIPQVQPLKQKYLTIPGSAVAPSNRIRKSSNVSTPTYILSPQLSPIYGPHIFFPSSLSQTPNYFSPSYNVGFSNIDQVFFNQNTTFSLTPELNKTYFIPFPTNQLNQNIDELYFNQNTTLNLTPELNTPHLNASPKFILISNEYSNYSNQLNVPNQSTYSNH